jgi:putative molybdopterin biosynthesis protein
MTTMSRDMMNTREVADYLRIKERKVYDLVRARKIPCSRVTGKWLFPKAQIDAWVAQGSDAAELAASGAVLAGSHDPLLEWAVRESRCGLAIRPGGSRDGLALLASGDAMLAGVHLIEEDGGYNVAAALAAMPARDFVVLEWARREQGLIVAPGNPHGIAALADLRGRKLRFASRQPEAGSHELLLHLLKQAGLKRVELNVSAAALSESDLALAVAEGKADAGLGIRAVAQQCKLGFVKLHVERFDLVMRRRDYFEPPVQKLFAFARSAAFVARAAELGGYDVGGLGNVTLNA